MKKVKVLFHLNDPGRWPAALQNIRNLLKDVGQDGADVAVVASLPRQGSLMLTTDLPEWVLARGAQDQQAFCLPKGTDHLGG